jgi:hypothetical protein
MRRVLMLKLLEHADLQKANQEAAAAAAAAAAAHGRLAGSAAVLPEGSPPDGSVVSRQGSDNGA